MKKLLLVSLMSLSATTTAATKILVEVSEGNTTFKTTQTIADNSSLKLVNMDSVQYTAKLSNENSTPITNDYKHGHSVEIINDVNDIFSVDFELWDKPELSKKLVDGVKSTKVDSKNITKYSSKIKLIKGKKECVGAFEQAHIQQVCLTAI